MSMLTLEDLVGWSLCIRTLWPGGGETCTREGRRERGREGGREEREKRDGGRVRKREREERGE